MTQERNRRPYANVLETIGWTPLIRLNSVTRGIRTPVYGKAEFFNPGASVKDRIGTILAEVGTVEFIDAGDELFGGEPAHDAHRAFGSERIAADE